MINVDKVFLMHYLPLEDRKQNILEQNKKAGLDIDWVCEEPDFNNIYEFYDNNAGLWESKVSPFNYGSIISPRDLRKSEISLAYKHLLTYRRILDNKYSFSLILEDDVIFVNNFQENFNSYLQNTPSNWDFIFLGFGCNLRVPPNMMIDGQTSYRKMHPASKCTDSYIVSYKAVQKIMSTMDKISLPIDFELNYQMWKNNLNVYWWEPHLIKQGSQCGLYESKVQ
jgi:GR25 family glycosyltransferase involved in LPS biosynthesis